MFTQQNIKEIILGFEENYPVDAWVVNGVHIWPYVRIKLYIHVLVLMNKNKSAQSHMFSKKKKIKKFALFIKQFFLVFEAKIMLFFFFKNLKNKKILFFGSHMHRVLNDGKYFNRFYDSMVDFHELQNEVYMLEYQKIYDINYNQKAIIPLVKYLNYYKLITKFKGRFYNETNKLDLYKFDDFHKELSNYNFNLNTLGVSKNEIIDWSNRILSTKKFFDKFYKSTKPLKVIFLGYYGLDNLYSALYAANNLKIETIDFQHGPQTNVHLAFAFWNKVPASGFNTMPKTFWNWDFESKKSIDNWSKKTNLVKSKVVGQPYVAYWTNKFKNSFKSKKEFVLYSLQTTPFSIEDLLTPKIITLIKQNDYQWVLRLHPRNNLNLEDLNTFILRNKIEDKCIIQDAISIPLPEVLHKSIVHITNYSGCLIEARLLGVPSILINVAGKEIFNQYIDDKLVFYENQEDLDFVKNMEVKLKELEKIIIHNKDYEVFNPLN